MFNIEDMINKEEQPINERNEANEFTSNGNK